MVLVTNAINLNELVNSAFNNSALFGGWMGGVVGFCVNDNTWCLPWSLSLSSSSCVSSIVGRL